MSKKQQKKDKKKALTEYEKILLCQKVLMSGLMKIDQNYIFKGSQNYNKKK